MKRDPLFHAYIAGASALQDKTRILDALKSRATSLGGNAKTVIPHYDEIVAAGEPALERPGLKSLLARVSDGDTVLFQSIASISNRPSEIMKVISTLRSKNIRVDVLAFNGGFNQSYDAILDVIEATLGLEEYIQSLEAEFDRKNALRQELYETSTKQIASDLVQKFGIGALLSKLGDGEQVKGSNLIIGSSIRERRKALGLTQRELADKAEVRQDVVSAVENGENSGSLQDILETLHIIEAERMAKKANGSDGSKLYRKSGDDASPASDAWGRADTSVLLAPIYYRS